MGGTMQVVLTNYNDLMRQFNSIRTGSEKAVRRTINDFKSRGPGWISQEIAAEYNIKKKDINEAKKSVGKNGNSIKIAGTKVDDLAILYRGRLLTPTHFGMKPTTRPTDGAYVVSAQIKKAGGRKPLGNRVYLARAGGQGTTQIPFQRRGAARTPTDVIKTLSVPQMITNKDVSDNIRDRIGKELGKRLQHHLEQCCK